MMEQKYFQILQLASNQEAKKQTFVALSIQYTKTVIWLIIPAQEKPILVATRKTNLCASIKMIFYLGWLKTP